MGRAEIVDRCQELYEDLNFGSVRAWLAEEEGRFACGVLPVHAPREVVAAAGVLPVGVHGGGDHLEIIRGDAYYQSYICHLPRSVVELGLSGRLDWASAMLFPATCDVIRNLSGMWQMLEPGTYVRYVDLPQVREWESAGPFWMDELRTLVRDMSEISGKKTSDDDIKASIAAYNTSRGLIEALYEARRKTPWNVPSEELYLVMRAGEVLPVDDFNQLMRDYLAAAEAEPGRPKDNCRVVVVGAFCEQPPLGLIKTLERAGCYLVDDDFLLGNRLLSKPVSLDGDPIEALARTFLESTRESSILYEPDPCGKRQSMRKRVDASGADGIVFAAPSFCDPALLDRPMLRAGAEADNIPCIAFKYSENTGQFQQFREQAGTFSDAIKLWGGA